MRLHRSISFLSALSLVAASLVACDSPDAASDALLDGAESLPEETWEEGVGSASAPLLREVCPWGDGECVWPTASAPTLEVTASATAVKEVGARFRMQGTAFLTLATVKASRSATSGGTLVVELRGEAVNPKSGALLATGKLAVSELCVTGEAGCTEGALVKTVALLPKRPLKKVEHGKYYWLRVYADGADAQLLLAAGDGTQANAAGQTLQAATGSGTTMAKARNALVWTGVPGTQLAFLPGLTVKPGIGCLDGIANGQEADVDCGVACGKGCTEKKFCKVAADCRGDLICKPLKGGLDDSICKNELCACAAKLKVGSLCLADKQCVTGRCSNVPGQARICEPTACVDTAKSLVSKESDVDCGGQCAAKCAATKGCVSTKDCAAGLSCLAGLCTVPGALGASCTADDQCASRICMGATGAKVCAAPVPTGGACTRGLECASQKCLSKLCAAPKATDLLKNGTETAVDCGGASGKQCGLRMGCEVDADCSAGLVCGAKKLCLKPVGGTCTQAAHCLTGICAGATGSKTCRAAPTCDDGVQNGDETGIDCGGACVAQGKMCAVGKKCVRHADCASNSCTSTGMCKATTCKDGIKNGSEVDVDCGGATCGGCGPGTLTMVASNCASKVLTADGRCAYPQCDDGVINGKETGIDPVTGRECGGDVCGKCPRGVACKLATDCQLGTCPKVTAPATQVCVAPVPVADGKACQLDVDCKAGLQCLCKGLACATGAIGTCASTTLCGNGIKDNGETDVDCGGVKCGRMCVDGKICAAGKDCESGVCSAAKKCAAPTYTDKVKNGDETGVDCGGPTAAKCPANQKCGADADCDSGYCHPVKKVCAPAPSGACLNLLTMDCGRSCSIKCEAKDACRADVDCASLLCLDGTCAASNCFIGSEPYPPEEPNPQNSCEWCDVRTPDVWAARTGGSACDDGDPATFADACAASACVGTPSVCAANGPNNPCAVTIAVADGSPCLTDADCPEGDLGTQTCVNGRCQGETCRALPTATEEGPEIACRPKQGACDVEEICIPGSISCPADLVAAGGAVCRAPAGTCDEPEFCDGFGTSCGPDNYAVAGTVCRSVSGDCDASESCTGASPLCPADRGLNFGDFCAIDGEQPGQCSTELVCEAVSGCFISNIWYREGETDATGCKRCDPATSATAWTLEASGARCAGGTCSATGACTQLPKCTISGKSYLAWATDPTGCGYCDPTKSTASWTLLPSGSSCTGGGTCNATGQCGFIGCSPSAMPPTAAFKIRQGQTDITASPIVAPLSTVSLDGTVSTPSNGLNHVWRLVSQPQNGTQNIVPTAWAGKASLYAELAGEYVVELVVKDSTGCTSAAVQKTIRVVAQDKVHIQLTWAENYGDVDLHLLGPGGTFASSVSDCHYANCKKSDRYTIDWGLNNTTQADGNQLNDPSLDVDQVWGNGPENINNDLPFDGTYTINVHYFCAKAMSGNGFGPPLGPATATIKVYVNGILKLTKSQALNERHIWTPATLVVSNGGQSVSVNASTEALQTSTIEMSCR